MELDINVYFSDRKTITLQIKKDKTISVRAPRHYTKEDVHLYVMKNKNWLVSKLAEIDKKSYAWQFVPNSKIIYEGELFEIVYDPNQKKAIKMIADKFVFSNQEPEQIKKIYKAYLKHSAKKILVDECNNFAKILGLKVNQIKISSSKTRWGSCSSKRNINLNYRLMIVPKKIRLYVIIHELCHIIHMNHSKEFWGLVAKFFPDYKNLKKHLKDNSDYYDID